MWLTRAGEEPARQRKEQMERPEVGSWLEYLRSAEEASVTQVEWATASVAVDISETGKGEFGSFRIVGHVKESVLYTEWNGSHWIILSRGETWFCVCFQGITLTSAFQSVVCEPGILASPGTDLKQTPSPQPRSTKSESVSDKIPRWFVCTIQFERQWYSLRRREREKARKQWGGAWLYSL